MRNAIRITLAGTAIALFAAACARDNAPTAVLPDLLTLAPDSIGATSGQASLPGFTMSPDNTFQGTLDVSSTCAYSTTSGRIECTPVSRNGLTITRSFAFMDASGATQTHRDSLTRSMNTRVSVTGTVTTTRGVSTVNRTSSLTVSGLGKSSTSHTINGTESGTTNSTFTTDQGSVTIQEQFSAATTNVVVPAPFTSTSWPLSGTTTRQSTVTGTRGTTTRTSTSSEQATYNGTSVIPVVFTRDGQTRNCTRDLAAHTTSCK